jgi:uncharacterized protein YigA (DUF484 family)
MSTLPPPSSPASSKPHELEPEQVSAYLRANPAFLADHPELYAVMDPPRRVHGKVLADHMDAMLRAARAHAAEMDAKATAVLNAGRAAGAIADRVQEAVLAALLAADPVEYVVETLPGFLGVDAATLVCEAIRPRWRTLPPGAIKGLLRNRPVVFRDRPADAVLLHAEAALLAERDILVHLPGDSPALLALVSRDASALPAMQGMQALAFLGRVLAALVSP